MGGSKDPQTSPTRRLLPRTQSMSNLSKADYIRHEVRTDLSQAVSGPQFFHTMAAFMILVPAMEAHTKRVKEKIMQLLFDFNIWRKLEDARVINWFSPAKKLCPLWTRGDGNCLPHSVSLYLWGIHDEELFLRRLIHKTLSDPASSGEFRSRWKHAKRYMNSTIPEGGVQYDNHEWDLEWAMVVDLASDAKQLHDPNALPYKSLEEIHIFVLANIIRRPIIVLSEGVIRRLDGSSLAPNDIGGVYLPTLCISSECIKSPVILCYDTNHFVPLLSIDEPNQPPRSEHIVPIVTSSLGNLPVHFLLECEENQVHQLLEKYLNLVEMTWKKTDQVDIVLGAAIHRRKLPEPLNLMDDFCSIIECDVLNEHRVSRSEYQTNITPGVVKHEEDDPPYRHVGGSFRTNPGENEPGCSGEKDARRLHDVKPAAQRVSPERTASSQQTIPLAVEVQQLAAMKSRPCITPGCEFHGLPEDGGRCSVCVKEFTRNMAMKESETSSSRMYEPSSSWARSSAKPSVVQPLCKSPRSPEQTSRQTIEESRSFPPFPEASVEYSKCRATGCDIFASRSTLPYCVTHQPKGTIISTVRTDRENPASSVGSYYARHVSPEASSEPRCESNSLESVLFSKKCIVGGCRELGDPLQSNMCSVHFEDYRSSQQAKKAREKNIPFVPEVEMQGFVSTPKTGVEGRGVEDLLCRNKRCSLPGVPALNGYCHECSEHFNKEHNQAEQQLHRKESLKQRTAERPKSWAPSPHSPTKLGMLVDLGLDNEVFTTQLRLSSPPPRRPTQHSVKRTHPVLPETQRQLPEKSRRVIDQTLPQFSRYRNYVEESHTNVEPEQSLMCRTEGCYGPRRRDGLCTRCEQRRTPSMPCSPPAPPSGTLPGGMPLGGTSPSSTLPGSTPPLAHSSDVTGNDQTRGASYHGEENTSYEREMQTLPQCTFRACGNPGLEINNGLCQQCFNHLAMQRRITISGLSSRKLCTAPGCDMFGTPEADDLCSQCYVKTREGFQEERRRDYGRWHYDDVQSISIPTRTSLEPLSPSITASPCKNHHCIKFGDPAFDGFCSTCYNKYDFLHARSRNDSRDVPVSYSSVRHRQDNESSTSDDRLSYLLTGHNIALCRNKYVKGCKNYGNSACKGYCNSCYIEQRLNMY